MALVLDRCICPAGQCGNALREWFANVILHGLGSLLPYIVVSLAMPVALELSAHVSCQLVTHARSSAPLRLLPDVMRLPCRAEAVQRRRQCRAQLACRPWFTPGLPALPPSCSTWAPGWMPHSEASLCPPRCLPGSC